MSRPARPTTESDGDLSPVASPTPVQGTLAGKSAVATTALLLILAMPASGAVWNVYPDGSGDASTIGEAATVAAANDSVFIHPGTYFENGIAVGADSLHFLGQGTDPEDVVIEGSGEKVFELSSATAWFQRLTIRDANYGVHSFAAAMLADVRVEGCRVGIRAHSARLDNCTLSGNGIGVHTVSDLIAADCTFELSGYVALDPGGDTTFDRCHFERNRYTWIWGAGSMIFDGCTFDYVPSEMGAADPPETARRALTHLELRNCVFDGAPTYTTEWTTEFVIEGCSFRNLSAPILIQSDYTMTTIVDSEFRGTGESPWLIVDGGSVTVRRTTVTGFDRCADIHAGFLDLQQTIFADWTGSHVFAGANPYLVQLSCCNFWAGANTSLDAQMAALLEEPTVFSAEPGFCDRRIDSDFPVSHIQSFSKCAAGNNICGVRIGVGRVKCRGRGVYVATSPPGLLVRGDGAQRAGEAAFHWAQGTSHEISVPSPQHPRGVRHNFTGWDDGGAQAHHIQINASGTIATATFDTEYELLMVSGTGGTVSPDTDYYLPGASVSIEAIPDSGFALVRWIGSGSGSYDGPNMTATVTLEESLVQEAIFNPGTYVTVRTDPPGYVVRINQQEFKTPVTRFLAQGTQVTIGIDDLHTVGPGERLRFKRWSTGAPQHHSFQLLTGDPVDITATLSEEYELAFDPKSEATFVPGDSWYALGTSVEIEAVPGFESEFVSWTGKGEGSYTGTDNPASVTMTAPVHQTANLVPRFDGSGYDFTISASGTDPFDHSAPPTGGLRELFLWGSCLQRGLAAFTGRVTGTFDVLGFNPAPNVLNAGIPTEPLLAIGGCPTGSDANFLIGSWFVLDHGGWMCFAGADSTAAVDCEGGLFESPGVVGFASDGSSPCEIGENGCESGAPVHLTEFSAGPGDRVVHLSWITASTTRSDGFHIYRSEAPNGELTRQNDEIVRGRSPYEWIDRRAAGGGVYYYHLGAVDASGREQMLGPVRVETPVWKPHRTELSAIAPNPSVGSTEIHFALARSGETSLVIYDVSGRRVQSLYSGVLPAGEHRIRWDGRNSNGRVTPPGVYFARLLADGTVRARKLLRIGTD